MKRLFTLLTELLALLWSCSSLRARTTTDKHENHTSRFVGDVASLWVNSGTKTTPLGFHPELGYFFSDIQAVGLTIGYGLKSYEMTNRKALQRKFSLPPSVHYYFLHKGPFSPYLDGNVGYSYERQGEHNHQGFEAGLRPDACLDLTDGSCLYMRLGFLGYHKSSHDDEPGVSSSGFELSFTPECLMVGLELES